MIQDVEQKKLLKQAKYAKIIVTGKGGIHERVYEGSHSI